MTNGGSSTSDDGIKKRIKELGEKSSQTLIFLSFALIVVATLKDKSDSSRQVALRCAMYWWSWAIFPVVLGILPLKECKWENQRWYSILRWIKVVLLWIAVILILHGAWAFSRAIPQAFSN
jgi:hypothetical protein